MKKIKINNFEECLFYEKLKNKLEVYLVPLKNKQGYYISFNTKYGNINTDFKVNNKKYNTPSGIAHFLEHKLFESNNKISPFDFYSKSGTDVNAGTSIFYTSYYCIGNNAYENNLKYLLNWITSLYVTDETVEKEKGIILQEANMGNDNPERVLHETIRKNTFVNDSYRKRVIGENEDIASITKDDLITCYKSFYRPDNMFIIVTGNFDENKTIEIIRKELNGFKNPKDKVVKINQNEPDKVFKEYEETNLNIKTPRIGISYKMNKNIFKLDEYKTELYLDMFLSLAFGSTSSFNEDCLKNNIFNSFIFYPEKTNTHRCLTFSGITDNPNLLLEKIDNTLKNSLLTKEDFERIKKSWIANEIRAIDNVNALASGILSDIIYFNEFKNNVIDDIKKLTYEELKGIINTFDLNNKAIIKAMPKK